MSQSDATLRLSGVVDVATVAGLWPALRARMSGGDPVEVIDLQAVTALDSSGVAMIRCLQAASAGRSVRITSAPPRFAQIGLAHRVEAGGN